MHDFSSFEAGSPFEYQCALEHVGARWCAVVCACACWHAGVVWWCVMRCSVVVCAGVRGCLGDF
eukprot:8380554-Pyramimonas_sp.AAC.1